MIPKLPNLRPIKKDDFSHVSIENKKEVILKVKEKPSDEKSMPVDNISTDSKAVFFLLAIPLGYLVSKYII